MYVLGRIFPAAIAFFGIALYTRRIDPATFGIYALLLSISFLVGTTAYSWLRVAALRMMGTVEPRDEPDYAATIAISFAVSSCAVVLAIGIIVRCLPIAASPMMIALTALAAIVSGWFELNVSVAQARLHLVSYGLLQFLRAAGTLTASVALIAGGWRVEALLGGFIIGNSVSLFALPMWRTALHGTFRMDVFRRIGLFGWPSSAASLSSLSGTFQRFAVQLFGGAALLGIYAAVSDFASQTIGLLIGTAAIAGQPLSFRARDSGEPLALEAQLRNNARLVFMIGAGATAGIIVLAQPLANLYLGPKFRLDAGPLITWFALATLVGGVRASYFEQGFEIVLKMRPIAILTAIRIACYIGLSLVLIPRYGALGAAYAAFSSELLLLAITIVWTRRLLHMPIPLWSFAKMTVAAVVMAGFITLVPGRDHVAGVAVAIVAGAVVYGLALVALYPGQVCAAFARPRPQAVQ